MKKASDILALGKNILKKADIESFAFDAAVLFEHTFGMTKTDVILNPDKLLCDDEYISLCNLRAGGKPLQYILGKWEFMGLDFKVNESVLIPRADTETLTEYIIEKGGSPTVLDMCTGSGCIGISIAHFLKGAKVTLADISENALAVAKDNAEQNGVTVDVVLADLKNGYSDYFKENEFDVIVSNPPYIKSDDMETLSREVKCEPYIALDGGVDGTDFYKALILLWKDALKDGGIMVLESGYDTWQDICTLFTECGYRDIVTKRDINGIVRMVSAKKGE